MYSVRSPTKVELQFQCSSASRKFLNLNPLSVPSAVWESFSALQRAENSSIYLALFARSQPIIGFQCSSASRKFLNLYACQCLITSATSFSALQRAENSSIIRLFDAPFTLFDVSVLFSEPKIPQSRASSSQNSIEFVSVLFSEPKIPQFEDVFRLASALSGFSALQRAENSSIRKRWMKRPAQAAFQCSSASRKFLNSPTSH